MNSLGWHLNAQAVSKNLSQLAERHRDWFQAGGPTRSYMKARYWQTEAARVSAEERAARIGEQP